MISRAFGTRSAVYVQLAYNTYDVAGVRPSHLFGSSRCKNSELQTDYRSQVDHTGQAFSLSRAHNNHSHQIDLYTIQLLRRLKITVAAAQVWNGLPEAVISSSSLQSFRLRLKTHLFQLSYPHLIL